MLFSLILISIEKPGTKIKKTNAHFNFDLKWVSVTLLLHFFENHPFCEISVKFLSKSESAKYSKHLINRVLHGAPIIEIIFLREENPVLALLMLSAKQGSHWYHF